jgi:hypothetical protein
VSFTPIGVAHEEAGVAATKLAAWLSHCYAKLTHAASSDDYGVLGGLIFATRLLNKQTVRPGWAAFISPPAPRPLSLEA